MPEMDEIRWGIIGCGDVTEVKSGPAFNRIAHSSLVAVMRRDGKKAEDYARRHGVPRWYADAARLIADPEVNAIYIATPPDAHAAYTREAALAGKPVYVEKPMARTYVESQEMIAVCEEAGVPLFVAYYRRCLPAFLKVKELVDQGAIGAVRLINLRFYQPAQIQSTASSQLPWRVRPEISGGGFFYDLASHQFDFLDYVFGPITTVRGWAANQGGQYPAEDIVTANWMHHNGVLGSGVWCFTTAPGQNVDDAEIVGSEGSISISSFNANLPVRLDTKDGRMEFQFPRQDPIQQPLIETVVASLRGEGDCPSTGRSAARTNWVLEQALSAYRQSSESDPA